MSTIRWLQRCKHARRLSGGRPPLPNRASFPYVLSIQTRFKDNDMFGHVNNVEYYSYIDTVITHFMFHRAEIKDKHPDVLPFCAQSQCTFLSSLTYPDTVEACLGLDKLGKSSMTYKIGLYKGGESTDNLAALGSFTHVFVDKDTWRPVPIPEDIRSLVQSELT